MGGLIAESAVWESFTDDWQTVLDEYIGGKWFHMKDYVMVPGVGPYVGWDESKRRDFLGKLVNTIVSRDIRYVGCVVSIDGFDALPPQLQEGFVDPYYMAFQHATHGCSICGLNIEDPFSPEKVAMVYAYQDTFGAINSGSALPRNQGRRTTMARHEKPKYHVLGSNGKLRI
ncbi:hypothetical protein [Granulicella mallensis]|uniref:Uncharacterized protein n=1 Tax=Granulicella mallensis (strain ATCC BAA-1857 / DSM 23137 / MP5ACTX8) TaxID=682795 RepID=G8NP83_GRAMM|nr:hypothetical protein [Granulicella mallensis]AEU38282.1 hypothetical protein AciX8_3999 [Granulicella mallensis MP5ACTX8]